MKLVDVGGAIRFEVWAKPRAKKSRVLGVPRRAVSLLRGETSQRKLVEVRAEGASELTLEEARRRLTAP